MISTLYFDPGRVFSGRGLLCVQPLVIGPLMVEAAPAVFATLAMLSLLMDREKASYTLGFAT
jgi:hypothetical protein